MAGPGAPSWFTLKHWPLKQLCKAPQLEIKAQSEPLSQNATVQSFRPLPGQTLALPPLQAPFWQMSLIVQASPSSQASPVSAIWLQPLTTEQLSEVQVLLSSQGSAGLPPHTPLVQTSAPVQTLPSSQGVPLTGERTSLAIKGWHEVQGLPGTVWSLLKQLILFNKHVPTASEWTHWLPLQRSSVQNNPSSGQVTLPGSGL